MQLVHRRSPEASRTASPKGPNAVPDWTLVRHRSHAVQFYEDDEFLVELLSRFVGASLATGDSAIVVATAQHRAALAERLLSRGFDLSIPLKQGRYVPLDAAASLASFMQEGAPDPTRFTELVCPIVEDARTAARDGRGQIAAFGEMVALLWADGKIDAALQLEEMWNRLADIYAFSLCCAYPMRGFLGDAHAAPFLKICAQHTHVFASERGRSASL